MHLKKGDKLVRSIRQILYQNFIKIRKKSTMCRAVKHFDHITMVKKFHENQINSHKEE